MQQTYRLSDITIQPIERISTGIEYLDLAYGVTVLIDKRGRPTGKIAGLPVGGLSLWSGSPGVGKSRISIAVGSSMNIAGYRVLFIQNEVDPTQFRQWTMDIANPDNFFVHTSCQLPTQLSAINNVKPNLIVLDSLNIIQGFQSPIVIKDIISSYKSVIQSFKAHAILIGHLNKAGSIKGNNDIQYLTDVECDILPFAEQLTAKQQEAIAVSGADVTNLFYMKFVKNRYGPISVGGHKIYVCFRHMPYGIECVTSSFDGK